jgi:hypothetical protein
VPPGRMGFQSVIYFWIVRLATRRLFLPVNKTFPGLAEGSRGLSAGILADV